MHKSETTKLNEKIKNKENEIKSLNEEVSKIKKIHDSLSAAKEELKHQMEKHDLNSKKHVEKLQTIITLKDEETEKLTKELKEKDFLHESIMNLKINIQKLQNEIDQLSQANESLKTNYAEIYEEKQHFINELSSKSVDIHKLKEEFKTK